MQQKVETFELSIKIILPVGTLWPIKKQLVIKITFSLSSPLVITRNMSIGLINTTLNDSHSPFFFFLRCSCQVKWLHDRHMTFIGLQKHVPHLSAHKSGFRGQRASADPVLGLFCWGNSVWSYCLITLF